jgi:hypothetical protein
LRRRGVEHGAFVPAPPPSSVKDARERFAADRPVLLEGALLPFSEEVRRAAAEASRFFSAARRGGGVADFVRARLADRRDFDLVGSSTDAFDAREIEKFYVHERAGGRRVAKDLYAKLSWISENEDDGSLRVRFSFGSETLGDWTRDRRRATAADRFAEVVFPEGRALARNAAIRRFVEACVKTEVRFSERIVYSNAPNGGAEFHHDAEPRQLGVLYGQFRGETAWLALPKRELAEALASFGAKGRLRAALATPKAALRALDDQNDAALRRLLDATPRFTRALVERGALIRLRAGDALLLPSSGFDACCWHAVFALGAAPSLAHSYGIFALKGRASPVTKATRRGAAGAKSRGGS